MTQAGRKLATSSFLFLALIAHSYWAALGQGPEPKDCSKKTVISGFPARPEELLGYVSTADRTAMRTHEWQILRALIDQAGRPAWEDWDSKCDVKLSSVGCSNTHGQSPLNGIRGLEFPVEMILNYRETGKMANFAYDFPQLKQDLENGPVLASVRFNPEAACHLLKDQLTDSTQLVSLLRDHLAHPADQSKAAIPLFDPRAIAVKLDWEFLEEQKGTHGASTKYYVHVFDPVTLKPAAPQTGGSYSLTQAPKVEVIPGQKCLNRDYVAEPIPLSCFYSLRVNDLTLPSNALVLQVRRQLLLGSGPHYVVLVGVHITTKETPDWTWATFYWSRRALDHARPENLNRLPTIKAPWNHYSMLTTFDADHPPDAVTGGQPICGSPYLEGKISHGASSNCLFCHRLASFTGSPTPRDSRPVGSPPYVDGQRQVDAAMQSAFLNDSLGTDFLWSLADVNVQQEEKFLEQFEKFLENDSRLHRLNPQNPPQKSTTH